MQLPETTLTFQPSFHGPCVIRFSPINPETLEISWTHLYEDGTQVIGDVRIPALHALLSDTSRFQADDDRAILDGITVNITNSSGDQVHEFYIQSPERDLHPSHYEYLDSLFEILHQTGNKDLKQYLKGLRMYFDK